MKRLLCLTIACLLFTTSSIRAGEPLGIGDAAPKLEVNEFVKGEPVKEFKPGQVYVVEFWATWCGPCKATIPHLTNLQKEHGDKAIFIGVSILERNPERVVPFVKEMGEKMEYRVCTDKVGKGQDADEGPMAKNWLTAAEQEGIPTAFIVNGEGKIAWIGHPSQMDTSLEEVIAGTYDLKKAKILSTNTRPFLAKFQKAAAEGNDAVLKLCENTIKDVPAMEEIVGAIKFQAMVESKGAHEDEVIKYGERLINDVNKNNAQQLNMIAWSVVDPARPSKATKPQIALALKAAQKGVDVSKGKDHTVIDTLACAHFANGDTAKAIDCIEKAIKAAPDEEEYKTRLEMFKKADKK